MARSDDYITLARNANRDIWNGINALVALQREWNAEDYGNTLADGTGNNAGITKVIIGAVIFDSANALVTTLNTGVATNMAKVL